jgi:hypothetical protein
MAGKHFGGQKVNMISRYAACMKKIDKHRSLRQMHAIHPVPAHDNHVVCVEIDRDSMRINIVNACDSGTVECPKCIQCSEE